MMVAPLAAAEKIIKLACDPFPPYVIESKVKNSDPTGSYVNFVQSVFAKIPEYRLKIEILPWKRCLMDAKNGKNDGVLMLFKTKEREAFLEYTDPVLTERMLLWYSPQKYPNGIEWETIEDLYPYIFGTHWDYKYQKDFDEAVKKKKIKTEEVREDLLNFKKLIIGRIDLVPIVENVAVALIKKNGFQDQIYPLQKPLKEAFYYIGFSKKSPHKNIIPRFNKEMSKIKAP